MLLLTACGGGSSGGGHVPIALPGPAVDVTGVNAFAAQLQGIVDDTTAHLLSVLPQQKPASAAGRGTVGLNIPGLPSPSAELVDGMDLHGRTGLAHATGLRIGAYGAPRYEVHLDLSDYSVADNLYLSGALDYSFVLDGPAGSAKARGLFAGTVDLFGSFGGRVQVRGRVEGDTIVALEIQKTGGDVVRFGGSPPGFIAQVGTVAGTGTSGSQNGPVAGATFNKPEGVAVDDDGHVYVADTGNGMVREIAPDGTASALASGFSAPADVGIDDHDTVIVSDRFGLHNTGAPLVRIGRNGPSRGSVTPIISAHDDATYPCGGNSCDGRSPIARMPWAGGIDTPGGLILVAQWALPHALRAVTPDGYLMTLRQSTTGCDPADVTEPEDLVQGPNGEIYFLSRGAVRVLNRDGTLKTIAGQLCTYGYVEGTGSAARFSQHLYGIAYDGAHHLYVTDQNLIRRVDIATGQTERVAGCLSHVTGFDCTNAFGFRDGTEDLAQFNNPHRITMDRWGDLYVADTANHAVRVMHILADPERTPTITRFDPFVLQPGTTTTITLQGTNLALTEQVDMGAGITTQVKRTGYRAVQVTVSVALNAAPGPRSVSVTTPYGIATTPPGLSLIILDEAIPGTVVETIAGTGAPGPDTVPFGPAEKSAFAFPTGMHAESADRLFVADPLEQRIRLITSKLGAVEEVTQLLIWSSTGADVNVLGAILDGLGTVGSSLGRLGISSAWSNHAQDQIRSLASQAVDEVCQAANSPCVWLTLPWAGMPFSGGNTDGFRLKAQFLFPTDVWAAGNHTFYIADAGNNRIRIVGYQPGGNGGPKPNEVFTGNGVFERVFSIAASSNVDNGHRVHAGLPVQAILSRLNVSGNASEPAWAGITGDNRCAMAPGDTTHPLGMPMGIATKGTEFTVTDPFCKTLWRVTDNNGPQVTDLRGDFDIPPMGPCADGPAAFATFGAPMDATVDDGGRLFVVDAACHSVRMVRDEGAGLNPAQIAARIGAFLEARSDRLPPQVVDTIRQKLLLHDPDFLKVNRFWVRTLAGSGSGLPGYIDGPAGLARFDSPTSVVAVAKAPSGTSLFVGDTGNHRVRRIAIP